MNVSVIGSGYVGTTLAACLADIGHSVVNIDIDQSVVDSINAGRAPIHEDGLAERIAEYAGERLRATTDYAAARETEVTFLCLPTPSKPDGSLDTGYVEAATESLGEALATKNSPHVVVTKSTVLPGTTETVVGGALDRTIGSAGRAGVSLAMNPEFLREGSAVHDFLHPDKIVVGAEDQRAKDALHELYAPLLERESDVTLVDTDVKTAEMIKYANNSMLAAKVSLVNEIGNICKRMDIDSYDVMETVGLDHRIGSAFLRSGLGWGGSCFPKDVDALRAKARELDYEPSLLDAAVEVNDDQPRHLVDLLATHVDLEGAHIAVLGLAFKPGTDDVRESRALDVIEILETRGANVTAYDPVAGDNATAVRPGLSCADTATEALSGADGAVIATDWEEFEQLSFADMSRSVVVDGRHLDIDTDAVDVYEGLCW